MSTRLRYQLARRRRFRERKKILSRFLVYLLAAILMIFALIAIFFIPFFRISNIGIEGLAKIPEEEVREKVDENLAQKKFFILPGDNFWLQNSENLVTLIKSNFPSVRTVEIDRDFPRGLTIKIEEYLPWGVLCHGVVEKCFWIDADGVAFEEAPEFSGLIVPKIVDKRSDEPRLAKKLLSPELMRLVSYFNERAANDDLLQSVQFIIDEKDETLRVRTRAGWDIILLESLDPEEAYKNLRLTLEGEIKNKVNDLEYIDLRFGNKIFYKFRSGSP